MRSLHKVSPLDCAPVLDPAYRDTSAVARNMTGAVESLAMWVDAEPAEVRSMLEAGQASRFFKRTDRPSGMPEYAKGGLIQAPVAVPEVRESEMVDDPAVALRNYDGDVLRDGEQAEVSWDQHLEETRAMHNSDTMCMRYTDGEPCVKGTGHEGDHAGRCWGRHDGLPCNKVIGHHGPHSPMEVDDDEGRGPGRPRTRDAGDTEDAQESETRAADGEHRTLTGPEALAAVFAMRDKLTSVD
jgi:hypothetical protein